MVLSDSKAGGHGGRRGSAFGSCFSAALRTSSALHLRDLTGASGCSFSRDLGMLGRWGTNSRREHRVSRERALCGCCKRERSGDGFIIEEPEQRATAIMGTAGTAIGDGGDAVRPPSQPSGAQHLPQDHHRADSHGQGHRRKLLKASKDGNHHDDDQDHHDEQFRAVRLKETFRSVARWFVACMFCADASRIVSRRRRPSPSTRLFGAR